MKEGMSLTDLAKKIEDEQNRKRDFVIDTREINMVEAPGIDPDTVILEDVGLQVADFGNFRPTPHTHGQIADRLQIPRKYYNRMLVDSPDLLRNNVNHWFREAPERRLVRCMNGNARAFLSDRYRVIDNAEVMEAVLPTLSELGSENGLQIESANVTESKLYVKAFFPKIQTEVKEVGDVVQAGILISNSEIGLGAMSVLPMIYRLVCKNGMIRASAGKRKYHTGSRLGNGNGEAFELYTDETLKADDKAFMLKVRDLVRAVATQKVFEELVDGLREAADKKIEGKVEKAVEVTAAKFTLTEDEQSSVLRHLIEGRDLSAWGLANAITRSSQDVEDYDRATDLERAGGQVIELAPSEWSEIAKAA